MTLNQNIDNAERFQAQPGRDMPTVDQSQGAQFALQMAQRASLQKEQEKILQMPPILPVAN